MSYEYSDEKCKCGHLRFEHDERCLECDDCRVFDSAETQEMPS